MNSLRQKHGGYWLALFAMALQLSFSFGHIHGQQHHVGGKLLLAVKSMLAPASPHHSGHHDHSSHDNSNDHQNNDREEKYSDICQALNAAGSLVLPVVASILGHFKGVETCRFFNNTAIVSTLVFLPYQVRAPPFAQIV